MIKRTLFPKIKERLFQGKAILLTGPRQVGKTTLIKFLIEELQVPFLFLNCDDPHDRELLENPNIEELKILIGNEKVLFVDEAQRVPNISLTAKLIIDQLEEVQLIMSGSSSFELSELLQEPLTGRKWTYELLPVSWEEWEGYMGSLEARKGLENRLIHGFYPDVIMHQTDSEELLFELVDSYLFKDVLTYAGIRKPQVLHKLVKALAFQVGQEVVYKEVGDLTGLDPKTVDHYIDILEKAFVVYRLPAFSRNLRNEIKNNRKIYFYDNGVRNAVINDFRPMVERQDRGALWENFLITERLKQVKYHKHRAQFYFWRSKQQQEVDLVEERGTKLYGFEFKWNPSRKIKFPKTFVSKYQPDVKGVNLDNFREFVIPF